jgi:hypothetical protein
MTIPLTGTGGLFTRLGRIGRLAQDVRSLSTTLGTSFESLMAQYDTLRTAVDGVPTLARGVRTNLPTFLNTLSRNAETTLLEMVRADAPYAAGSVTEALQELIRQMITAGASVKTQTVSGSAAVIAGNTGNGFLGLQTQRGDGLQQELIVPEVVPIKCTADSQNGRTSPGREQFTYYGEVGGSMWADNYPVGSGRTMVFSCVSADTQGQSGLINGNLLRNSNFETFTTTDIPDNWTVVSGTPTTNFRRSTAQKFTGTSSLEIRGTGATSTSIEQTFLSGQFVPLSTYALTFWYKITGGAAGSVYIRDADSAYVDEEIDCAAGPVVWTRRTVYFRTGRQIPTDFKLVITEAGPLPVGTNLFLDNMTLAPLTQLYPGGPGIIIVQADSNWSVGDGFTLTTTNNFGGASNVSTFQWLFERLFGMNLKGLLLPSAGSPTIADTLISA